MSIHRFRRRSPSVQDFPQFVPNFASIDAFGPEFADINLSNDATLQDLIDYMDRRQFEFVETEPFATPGDEITDASHGDRGGGTLHEMATQVDPGFMSPVNNVAGYEDLTTDETISDVHPTFTLLLSVTVTMPAAGFLHIYAYASWLVEADSTGAVIMLELDSTPIVPAASQTGDPGDRGSAHLVARVAAASGNRTVDLMIASASGGTVLLDAATNPDAAGASLLVEGRAF